MKKLGTIKDRSVYYSKIRNLSKWIDKMPTKPWVGIIIIDEGEEDEITYIANRCFSNNMVYLCAAGKQAKKVEDIFDMVYVSKKLNDSLIKDFISISNPDLKDAIEFAINNAYVDKYDTEDILCMTFKTNIDQYVIERYVKELKKT